MKIPKTIKKFCPFCKKHTDHKASNAKRKTRGTAHPLAMSAKPRSGFGHGFGNLGRWGSKPNKPKMTGKKQTKKTDLRFTCNVCKKTTVEQGSRRAKKQEFV